MKQALRVTAVLLLLLAIITTASALRIQKVEATRLLTVGPPSNPAFVVTEDGVSTFGGLLETDTTGVTGGFDVAGGNFTVATNKLVVTYGSGNTAIAGTLNVTGAATLSSTLAMSATNAAGGSANPFDYTATLGIMNGTDDFTLFDVNITNADHTGSTNTVQVLDIAAITGDTHATETAIKIGNGWDAGIATISPVTIAGQSAVVNSRHRVATADINAGATLVAGVAGRAYRIVDCKMIAYGGAVGGTTTVDVKGLQSTSTVKLFAFAQGNLTQSTVLGPGITGCTVLADGASFASCDAAGAITIGKTGEDVTTATGVDVILTYVVE